MEDLNKILEHIEYFGYKAIKTSPDEAGHVQYHITHPRAQSFTIQMSEHGSITFHLAILTNYTEETELEKFVNNNNAITLCTQLFVEKMDQHGGHVAMMIKSNIYGHYDKKMFAEFLNFFETDLKSILSSEELRNNKESDTCDIEDITYNLRSKHHH